MGDFSFPLQIGISIVAALLVINVLILLGWLYHKLAKKWAPRAEMSTADFMCMSFMILSIVIMVFTIIVKIMFEVLFG